MKQERKDVEQQWNKLFHKLEVLRNQCSKFGTKMTVIEPPHLSTQHSEPAGNAKI